MLCPACKAQNVQGPLCRRCRADLSLLFSFEQHQQRLLAEARVECAQGKWAAALGLVDVAAELQPDAAVRRFQAAVLLLMRDFPGAWRAYQSRREVQRSQSNG